MKNKRIERLIRSAKCRMKSWHAVKFKTKIGQTVYTVCYDHSFGEGNTWGMDFTLYGKKSCISVFWEHPRLAYVDACKSIALRLVEPDFSIFNSTPVYQKVGKSRKKVAYWKSKSQTSNYSLFKEVQEKLLKAVDNGVNITPSIKTDFVRYGRFVQACFDASCKNEKELELLAHDVVKYMHSTNLLPQTTYDVNDWIRENNNY